MMTINLPEAVQWAVVVLLGGCMLVDAAKVVLRFFEFRLHAAMAAKESADADLSALIEQAAGNFSAVLAELEKQGRITWTSPRPAEATTTVEYSTDTEREE